MRGIFRFWLVILLGLVLPDAAGADGSGAGAAPPKLDGVLQPIIRVPAEFPAEAPKTLTEGWVVVEFTLTARGGVEDPRAVRSSHKIFETEALRSVSRWKFRPRTVDGAPVAAQGVQTIVSFKQSERPQWTPVRLPLGQRVEILPLKILTMLRYHMSGSGVETTEFLVQARAPGRHLNRRKRKRVARALMESHVAAEIRQEQDKTGVQVTAGSIVFVQRPLKAFVPGGRKPDGVHELRFERDRRGNWRLKR